MYAEDNVGNTALAIAILGGNEKTINLLGKEMDKLDMEYDESPIAPTLHHGYIPW